MILFGDPFYPLQQTDHMGYNFSRH